MAQSAIPIVANVTADSFLAESCGGTRPLIVACKQPSRAWDEESIRSHLGNRVIDVLVYQGRPETGASIHRKETMQIAEYLDLGDRMPVDGLWYYAAQMPVNDAFGTLLDRPQELDDCISQGTKRIEKWWIGLDETGSPLHFDYHQNFLFMIMGRKQITIAAPSLKNMYAFSSFGARAHLSRVGTTAFDKNEFPDFPIDATITFELAAGQILYLPAFWWHQITNVGCNLMMNIWLRDRRHERSMAPAEYYWKLFPGVWSRSLLSRLRRMVGKG